MYDKNYSPSVMNMLLNASNDTDNRKYANLVLVLCVYAYMLTTIVIRETSIFRNISKSLIIRFLLFKL